MNRIRELRKAHGWTMKQLGAMIGVAESTVSLYETGKREPDNETIMKLADLMGVSLDYLMGREEQETDKDDVWELREQLRRDPDMRVLFSAARTASPDHIRAAAAMLKALKETENAD